MSVNKAILVGNVGKDPEVRHLDSGASVARFPIATTEVYNNKAGERVEQTEWHNIVAWRGLAKLAESYIKKGSQLYIEGRIRTTSYEKDGITRYSTEINADNIRLLGRKGETNASPQSQQQAASPTPAPQEQPAVAPVDITQEDDDLPF